MGQFSGEVTLVDQTFRILKGHHDQALAAVEALGVSEAATLGQTLEDWGLLPVVDDRGDITALLFREEVSSGASGSQNGDLGEDHHSLFSALAPYVEPGSFLLFLNERMDGFFRVYFDGRSPRWQCARLVFEDGP